MGPDKTLMRRQKHLTRGDAPHCAPWARFENWQAWLAASVLVAAGLTAYANSFRGVFVYDDLYSIVENPCIRTLWPLSEAMSLPLIEGGETVARRPLLSLSFALNHRLLGPEPWGFHLVNLAIHMTSALLLFGIVRRTLCLEPYRGRWGDKATVLALAIALLWEVHPLQTESVTYIVQRAESLMGMLYLLTLYCSLRGFTSRRGVYWYAAAVAACAAGMGVKEVMATAPLMVFLYDGTFVSASYRDAWRRRQRFYVALAATWLVLLLPQVLGWQAAHKDFTDRNPLAYAATQPGVILYYLRLSFWPSPLVMNYNWPTAEGFPEIAAAGCVVAVLLGATAWGLFRRRWYGLVGAWFFLILAPSSSFVALNQNLEEHRMYLSLAAVVVLTVVAGARLLQRLPAASRFRLARTAAGGVLVLALAAGLTAQTIHRNHDYRSRVALWRQNVEQRPTSTVAQLNLHMYLGMKRFDEGRFDEAIAHFRAGLAHDPKHAPAWYDLGCTLAAQRQFDAAAVHLRKAIALSPDNFDAHTDLGALLVDQGKPQEAVPHLRRALKIRPDFAKAYYHLANALAQQGELSDAVFYYRQSLMIESDWDKPHLGLANALVMQRRWEEARPHYLRTVRINPRSWLGFYNFAVALEAQGEFEQAIDSYRRSLKINPSNAAAHCKVGNLLAEQGMSDEALTHLREATRIDSRHWQAHIMLGRQCLVQGKREPAIESLQRALEIQPDSQLARNLLQQARGE